MMIGTSNITQKENQQKENHFKQQKENHLKGLDKFIEALELQSYQAQLSIGNLSDLELTLKDLIKKYDLNENLIPNISKVLLRLVCSNNELIHVNYDSYKEYAYKQFQMFREASKYITSQIIILVLKTIKKNDQDIWRTEFKQISQLINQINTIISEFSIPNINREISDLWQSLNIKNAITNLLNPEVTKENIQLYENTIKGEMMNLHQTEKEANDLYLKIISYLSYKRLSARPLETMNKGIANLIKKEITECFYFINEIAVIEKIKNLEKQKKEIVDLEKRNKLKEMINSFIEKIKNLYRQKKEIVDLEKRNKLKEMINSFIEKIKNLNKQKKEIVDLEKRNKLKEMINSVIKKIKNLYRQKKEIVALEKRNKLKEMINSYLEKINEEIKNLTEESIHIEITKHKKPIYTLSLEEINKEIMALYLKKINKIIIDLYKQRPIDGLSQEVINEAICNLYLGKCKEFMKNAIVQKKEKSNLISFFLDIAFENQELSSNRENAVSIITSNTDQSEIRHVESPNMFRLYENFNLYGMRHDTVQLLFEEIEPNISAEESETIKTFAKQMSQSMKQTQSQDNYRHNYTRYRI